MYMKAITKRLDLTNFELTKFDQGQVIRNIQNVLHLIEADNDTLDYGLHILSKIPANLDITII